MSLPKATIKFDNGNLDTVVSLDDGVFGLLASSSAVADTYELDKPYLVKGMKDVAALGITASVDNYRLFKWLTEFYAEAGEGTSLWIIGKAKTETVSSWFTKVAGVAPVEALLNKANGEISGIFTCYSPQGAFEPTIENGVDNDVPLAIAAAQSLAVAYTQDQYAPFFVVLEAYAYSGTIADLADLKQGSNNRVAVMIGSTEQRSAEPASNGASTSIVAGRLAKIAVSKNIGEVKAGALSNLTAFVVDTAVEASDIEGLHDKGYLSFRTHVRKSGYYFADSPLATSGADDYKYIELRRTIDKALRLAHEVVSNEILTDFPVTPSGTVDVFYAQAVQAQVEALIASAMTANNELSSDPSDKDDLGVVALMNTTKNVVSDSTLEMSIKVRPRGYNRFFEVLLGFGINSNN
jgi:hypothetical protein